MTAQLARSGRGRRPADEVRRDALDAAARLLLEQGVAGVTYDRVAASSTVSRTTLYKWWPSAAALAAEAFFTASEPELELVDTGDVRADLRAQLGAFADLMLRSPAGPALRGLIAAAQSDDAVLAALQEHYVRPRRRIGGAALERAQQRGQLAAGVDVQVVVDQIWGACYYRLLTEPDTVTTGYLDALVSQALRGAR